MKHIYLNLKRFDIPKEYGGVNCIAEPKQWGNYIVSKTKSALQMHKDKAEFIMYFPEAHIINACTIIEKEDNIQIGCQSIYYNDTGIDGNFGAFTSNRTANAMKALGCTNTIIGHCEERKDKLFIMKEAGIINTDAVNRILNKEIKLATQANFNVLYCIGESAEEQVNWQEVLRKQIQIGLDGVDRSKVAIAYEPIWAIGPGKTPPDKNYIQKIASFIKQEENGITVVYGGGLKVDNARMLSSIPEIDGGLIALTRFEGEIGFYPEEYLEIIDRYMGK